MHCVINTNLYNIAVAYSSQTEHDDTWVMTITPCFLNSLLNNKILDWSKFKAFADIKINVTKKIKFVFERV